MRVLVTGGAGFIGTNVVEALRAAGHEAAVLDNLSTGSAANLLDGVPFFQADLRDAAAVDGVLRDFSPEVIAHHAAQIDVRKSTETPAFDAEVNIVGSLHLLQAALRHRVGKVVYASSGGAVYGEPAYLPADERHPVRPICEYGVSKHTVEHYLEVYGINYGLRYTILRYANVYGPRQDVRGEAGVVAVFTGQMLAGATPTIFGSGTAVRDYLYVGDVARANLLALTAGDGQTLNLGTGAGTSVNELFRLLAAATGFAGQPTYAPARVGEIERTWLDATLARDVLGWEPAVPLAEGIARTVAFVRGQG